MARTGVNDTDDPDEKRFDNGWFKIRSYPSCAHALIPVVNCIKCAASHVTVNIFAQTFPGNRNPVRNLMQYIGLFSSIGAALLLCAMLRSASGAVIFPQNFMAIVARSAN